MRSKTHRRPQVCVVGSGAMAAFLAWRLQAGHACDITVVWMSDFEHISQYGIFFQSPVYKSERFNPQLLTETTAEAKRTMTTTFDYVFFSVRPLLCVDNISVLIDRVVTPGKTCIIDAGSLLGVDILLKERYPTSTVMSLVSSVQITQVGRSEFVHRGSTATWLGITKHPCHSPTSGIEEANLEIAGLLRSGKILVELSPNIHQQQFEQMIGPIAFHPLSLILHSSDHSSLLKYSGALDVVSGVIDDLLALANAYGCDFPPTFKMKVINKMAQKRHSPLMQDFLKGIPVEVEAYLKLPMFLAQEAGLTVPHIQSLYPILLQKEMFNQTKRLSQKPQPHRRRASTTLHTRRDTAEQVPLVTRRHSSLSMNNRDDIHRKRASPQKSVQEHHTQPIEPSLNFGQRRTTLRVAGRVQEHPKHPGDENGTGCGASQDNWRSSNMTQQGESLQGYRMQPTSQQHDSTETLEVKKITQSMRKLKSLIFRVNVV